MPNTTISPAQALKAAANGLALEKYRLEKALVQGVEDSANIRCIHEMCRTLYTIKAYSTELRQPSIQSHIAATLVMCIPSDDDILPIREVASAIYSDTFILENSKALWKRMVHHVTPEHRSEVKNYLRKQGWSI